MNDMVGLTCTYQNGKLDVISSQFTT